MIQRPTRPTPKPSSAASDVYKRQLPDMAGTIELMLVGAQWIVVLGVVVAATAWAWLSLGGSVSYTHLRAHET